MYLSFKSVYNKEHKGVIRDLTYKVPCITVKLGDNCIQNFYLGSYIVGYRAGCLGLR